MTVEIEDLINKKVYGYIITTNNNKRYYEIEFGLRKDGETRYYRHSYSIKAKRFHEIERSYRLGAQSILERSEKEFTSGTVHSSA